MSSKRPTAGADGSPAAVVLDQPIRRRRSAPRAAPAAAPAAPAAPAAAPKATPEAAPPATPAAPAAPVGNTPAVRSGQAAPAESGVAPRRRRPMHPLRPLRGARRQLLAGGLLWIALGTLVYATSPSNPLALVGFFLLLFSALFFSLAPVLRFLSLRLSHSRLYQEASGMHATRQAVMLAAFVVLNALLQMHAAWSALTALLLFSMFAVIEVVALARR